MEYVDDEPRPNPYRPAPPAAPRWDQGVRITSIDIPFLELVGLLVQLAIAAIPAAIIIAVIYALVFGVIIGAASGS